MDIKCAALVLVLLTVTVELSETLPLLCANCLKTSPEGIVTGKVADIQKRQKKSLKDADINLDEVFASELADKLHSRDKRSGPPISRGIITMDVKLQSEMRKREKKSLKDPDINLNDFFASELADKLHSRDKRVPQEGKMTRKNIRLHSEVGKREQRSVEVADMNLDEYLASGLADKPLNRRKRLPPQGGIIMTTNNVKLHSELRKRKKKSLKDADMNLDEVFASELADKLHSRDKRVPQEGKMTRKNIRLHSKVGKREKKSLKDADMNLDEYFPLGMADKLHRVPPLGLKEP